MVGQRAQSKKGEVSEWEQKILAIRRVTRVVRGGRRFGFSVVMAVGNRRGKVGLGIGKAADVSSAVDKAARQAKKNTFTLRLNQNASLPHEVLSKFSSSRFLLRPARPGRGLIAGSAARPILSLAGVHDVTAKFTSKSKNKLNNARAVIRALENFV